MSVLDDIVAGVREDLERRRAEHPVAELRSRLLDVPPALDPLPALAAPGSKVIAEVKRRSPSKGALAEISDPAALASAYVRGGAAAVSVLTEERRFGGSLADLDAVRAAVSVPVLRKDFVVDDYQLVEARAHGADLVLLIAAALPGDRLARLRDLALELGLTPLVEVHDEPEAERAIAVGARLVGVNARSLLTLEVDTATFATLAPLFPEQTVLVAESGIAGADDVRRHVAEGAHAVLVGEALVRHGHPEQAVAAMTGIAAEVTA